MKMEERIAKIVYEFQPIMGLKYEELSEDMKEKSYRAVARKIIYEMDTIL